VSDIARARERARRVIESAREWRCGGGAVAGKLKAEAGYVAGYEAWGSLMPFPHARLGVSPGGVPRFVLGIGAAAANGEEGLLWRPGPGPEQAQVPEGLSEGPHACPSRQVLRPSRGRRDEAGRGPTAPTAAAAPTAQARAEGMGGSYTNTQRFSVVGLVFQFVTMVIIHYRIQKCSNVHLRKHSSSKGSNLFRTNISGKRIVSGEMNIVESKTRARRGATRNGCAQ
jgi:hypothetical protein